MKKQQLTCLLLLLFVPAFIFAQVNVTTFHNDNARTGQNTQETTLTPANVNFSQFGKQFTVTVDGWVYAQPLYVANVSINGGVHNVLYVATEHDSVYAIDADTGAIYWSISLVAAGGTSVSSGDTGCGDLVPEIGITGTPVIDTSTGTLYAVAKSKVNGAFFQYLHAIDISTHVEKFGGPKLITATVNGNGDGGTTVSFDPLREAQRPALLLQHNHVIIGWASHCDIQPYHGWVISYNASNLQQEAIFNTSPNGGLSGIWMSGGGLAGDASFNTYFASGNGSWDGTANFGDSIVKLGEPAGGAFPLADWFTPFNQNNLSGGDTDVGSGALVLLPDLPNGKQYLTQMGKEGKMYLVDRNNMGHFCSTCTSVDTNIVQEVPGATNGVWGSPAYWNGWVYWDGASDGGSCDNLRAFSFNANNSGLLSTSSTSKSQQCFSFAAPTPSVSSNGNINGIVWGLDDSAFGSGCCQVLYALDATNLANLLYTSNQAPGQRDVPGGAVKFATPTIANGRVYVGSQFKVSAFGPISSTPTAATPTFMPAPGDYVGSVNVTLSDTTPGAVVHCTTDGSQPDGNSPVCTNLAVVSTETISAIAVASGYNNSAVATGTYTIVSGGQGVNYGSGFSGNGLSLNGGSSINGTRLRLTDGGNNQARSAFYSTPLGVQDFTTDFSFQITNPGADGMTFTIQGIGATALGPAGGGLGYGPDTPGGAPGIGKSVAVKFDIYNNAGEGTDSTGLYTNGVSPTNPATDMTSSGVNLQSGDVFNVHMTYDGATLTMAVTDANNPALTFTTSWQINIPQTVGGTAAYVGFTAGTGGLTATQDVLNWTYVTSGSPTQTATPTFNPLPGNFPAAQPVSLLDATNGAQIYYTTDGSTPIPGTSPLYVAPIQVTQNTTINAIATANGLSNSNVATGVFTIQTATPTFDPPPGTFSAPVTVNLSDTTYGAVVHCTTDGSQPNANSPVCTSVSVNATETINAIAVAPNYSNSNVASGMYVIGTGGSVINFGSGFSASGLALNGRSSINGSRLRLTDGGGYEASSAFYSTLVGVQNFTTDFSFQLTNPAADGMTFTIQGSSATALGPAGGGLGYGPDTPGGAPGIGKSVAVKFDIYNNAGEGTDSTGLYTNGVSPSVPASDMTSSGVSLLSGDVFNVHMGYDGTTLSLTITDANNSAKTFSTSWAVNIPQIVGGSAAYVGFTGGTGGLSAIQEILNWTYSASGSQSQAATPTFNPLPGNYSGPTTVTLSDTTQGAVVHCTTDGTQPDGNSPVCTSVNVNANTTINAIAVAPNYSNSNVATGAYTIQAATPTFNPPPGTFSAPVTVNLSDTTSGAVVHCTTDGSQPTGNSPVCASVTVNSTETINAIAVAPNYSDSNVATGLYTISATPLLFEAEKIPFTASTSTRKLSWRMFSGGFAIDLVGTQVGDWITFSVKVPAAGTYDVKTATEAVNNRGIFQLSINGANLGPQTDEYSGPVTWKEFDLGSFNFPASGTYSFTFTVAGHNAKSKGYTLAFDYIKLTPQ